MTNTTITLEQFHDLLADAYAVSVNDTLYFVGYNTEDDTPYIADNDGDDYIDLSTVDGDIEVHNNYVFFYIQEQPIQLSFLQLKSLTNWNKMTFTDSLIAQGYVFDDENFDACYVKQDADGFIHLYQENVDDETDTLWNYVKMTDDYDVIEEKTFNPNVEVN